MRVVRFVALAIAVSASSGATLAADLTTIPLSTNQSLPVAGSAEFDWNGFYAGAFAGFDSGAASAPSLTTGINAGVNAQFDFYLVGAEVAVRGLSGDVGEATYAHMLGRSGLVVTDNAVVYAAGGYGIDLETPTEQDALLGGGVELAITDSVSLRAQYLHSFPGDQFSIGANFHF